MIVRMCMVIGFKALGGDLLRKDQRFILSQIIFRRILISICIRFQDNSRLIMVFIQVGSHNQPRKRVVFFFRAEHRILLM